MALCAAAMLPWPAYTQDADRSRLPTLGDTASDGLDLVTERKIGDDYMSAIRRDPAYLDDPVLLDYVQLVWTRLLASARHENHLDPDLQQHFALEAFLVKDKSVNAFAMPGGYIGVNLGLLATTTSTDELASVMAHELVHVTQRHIARGVSNSGTQQMVGMAAMLLGMVAASKTGNIHMANAAITGGQALAMQGQLNFSRDMEREADRLGFSVLRGAGYDPAGMAAMFEMLENASRFYDTTSYPYLRSHPLTNERIGEARSRMGGQSLPKPAPTLECLLIQARARVLMDTRAEALIRLQDRDSVVKAPAAQTQWAERVAAGYEGALASSLMRDHARAQSAMQAVQELIKHSPKSEPEGRRMVLLLDSELQLRAGNTGSAEAALGTFNDGSRPVLMQRAAVAAQPEASVALLDSSLDALQSWVSSYPGDALGWLSMVKLWARKGWPLRAARAEAEARYAQGDLTGAVDRLRAAQTLERMHRGKDPIEASVIDARARTLEAELRQRMAEQRRGR
jgi:predicted Zn-dependent protease